jgi:hypothetical protein
MDHFLNKAIEVNIDAVSDGTNILIGGMMGAHRTSRRSLW